jgi:hypothetical protein
VIKIARSKQKSVFHYRYCLLLGTHGNTGAIHIGFLNLSSEGFVTVLLKFDKPTFFVVDESHLHDVSHFEVPRLSY